MHTVTVTSRPSCLEMRPFLGSFGGPGRRWLCVACSGRDRVDEHKVEVTGWPSYHSFVRQSLHCDVVFLSEGSEVWRQYRDLWDSISVCDLPMRKGWRWTIDKCTDIYIPSELAETMWLQLSLGQSDCFSVRWLHLGFHLVGVSNLGETFIPHVILNVSCFFFYNKMSETQVECLRSYPHAGTEKLGDKCAWFKRAICSFGTLLQVWSPPAEASA